MNSDFVWYIIIIVDLQITLIAILNMMPNLRRLNDEDLKEMVKSGRKNE